MNHSAPSTDTRSESARKLTQVITMAQAKGWIEIGRSIEDPVITRYEFSARSDEEDHGPKIYSIVREMLVLAIEGKGTAGGVVEIYPMADGGTFQVVWLPGTDSAIFEVCFRSCAY